MSLLFNLFISSGSNNFGDLCSLIIHVYILGFHYLHISFLNCLPAAMDLSCREMAQIVKLYYQNGESVTATLCIWQTEKNLH